MNNQISRYLITTADESTWVFDRPVLFLGNWCLLNERKHVWSKLDYEIVSYHWFNPYDMEKDTQFVRSLYENLLFELTNVLNTHHKVEWTVRSWRILIGPWLLRFIEILYDRWKSIKALENYKISEASCADIDWDKIIPWDFTELSDLAKTDKWNYYVCSNILKYLGKIKLEEVNISSIKNHQKRWRRSSLPESFRDIQQ